MLTNSISTVGLLWEGSQTNRTASAREEGIYLPGGRPSWEEEGVGRDSGEKKTVPGDYEIPTVVAAVGPKPVRTHGGPLAAGTGDHDAIGPVLALACRVLDAACTLFITGDHRAPSITYHAAHEATAAFSLLGSAFTGEVDAATRKDPAAETVGAFTPRLPCVSSKSVCGSYLVRPVELSGRARGMIAWVFPGERALSLKDKAAAQEMAQLLAIVVSRKNVSGSGASPEGPRHAATDRLDPPEGGSRHPAAPSARLGGYKLTPTEMRVAALIMKNKSSKEIATALGVSTRTVEVHRANIRRKVGIAHSPQALGKRLADLAGLDSPQDVAEVEP